MIDGFFFFGTYIFASTGKYFPWHVSFPARVLKI